MPAFRLALEETRRVEDARKRAEKRDVVYNNSR